MEKVDRMTGTTVLVTGGSGFIGANLCSRLSSIGARVHAISRQQLAPASELIHWWQADLRDITCIRKVFKSVQPEIVFHLASHVTGARELGEVLPTFYDNLASTVHLLTIACETGCRRIVLACSSEEPLALDSTTFPCSPYAAAKLAGSIYGRMFYNLFKLPIVMPRIFMTYGPNQKDLQKLVPSVVLQLLRGESPKLSSGQRRADWTYIDDVVEGLVRAAILPGIEGCAFDLGTGSLVSVRQVVEEIVKIVGSSVTPAFGALADRVFEQERPADTGFSINRLGYKPETPLRQGLEATVASYRRQLTAARNL